MKLRQRLAALEKKVNQYLQQVQKNVIEDDEGWLQIFEDHAKQGHSVHEPDFPAALAAYRQALKEAAQDPLFEPPDTFEPPLPFAERRVKWREKHRTAAMEEVWAAWERVATIVQSCK